MTSPATLTRECKHCGRVIPVTPSGHLRAHACPHHTACVLSYAQRRQGEVRVPCEACKASSQLVLFP